MKEKAIRAMSVTAIAVGLDRLDERDMAIQVKAWSGISESALEMIMAATLVITILVVVCVNNKIRQDPSRISKMSDGPNHEGQKGQGQSEGEGQPAYEKFRNIRLRHRTQSDMVARSVGNEPREHNGTDHRKMPITARCSEGRLSHLRRKPRWCGDRQRKVRTNDKDAKAKDAGAKKEDDRRAKGNDKGIHLSANEYEYRWAKGYDRRWHLSVNDKRKDGKDKLKNDEDRWAKENDKRPHLSVKDDKGERIEKEDRWAKGYDKRSHLSVNEKAKGEEENRLTKRDDERLHLSVKPQGIQIFVKTMNGKTITLEVEASDTIENVKAKVQEKGETTLDQPRWMHAGRQLENGQTIREAGIQRHETIRMCGRLRGGANREPVVMQIEREIEITTTEMFIGGFERTTAIQTWEKLLQGKGVKSTEIVRIGVRLTPYDDSIVKDICKRQSTAQDPMTTELRRRCEKALEKASKESWEDLETALHNTFVGKDFNERMDQIREIQELKNEWKQAAESELLKMVREGVIAADNQEEYERSIRELEEDEHTQKGRRRKKKGKGTAEEKDQKAKAEKVQEKTEIPNKTVEPEPSWKTVDSGKRGKGNVDETRTATGSLTVIEQAARGRIISEKEANVLGSVAVKGKGNGEGAEQEARDKLVKSAIHPEIEKMRKPRPPITVDEKTGIDSWRNESRPITEPIKRSQSEGPARIRVEDTTEPRNGKGKAVENTTEPRNGKGKAGSSNDHCNREIS